MKYIELEIFIAMDLMRTVRAIIFRHFVQPIAYENQFVAENS